MSPHNIWILIVAIMTLIILLAAFFDKKDRQNKYDNDIKWFNNELEKRADVIFETSTGVYKRSGWMCYQTAPGNPFNIQLTAERRAKRYIEICYKVGYFEDDDGVTHSACNVIKAYVESKEIKNKQ